MQPWYVKEVRAAAVLQAYQWSTRLTAHLNDRHLLLWSAFDKTDHNERVFVAVEWDLQPKLLGAMRVQIMPAAVRIHALASFRHGVGASLLAKAENLATGLKTPLTALSTEEALQFYVSNGFTQEVDENGEVFKTCHRP